MVGKMEKQPEGQSNLGAARHFPIDALRGLIMVLMALDHANVFISHKHPPGEHWGGYFPVYEDAISFLTRLVTHPAAPGFSFLMGVGMLLFAVSRRNQGWSEWAITRHFLVRGVILIVLQFLVVNHAWQLGPDPFPQIYVGVLVALGGGMIIGAFLLRLPKNFLLVLAPVLFIGIELTHPSPDQWGMVFDQPLGLLFGYSGGDMDFWSNYPIFPWLELVVFGLVFGHWLLEDSKGAYRKAIILGEAFLSMFILVRYLNGFGNIRPIQGESWIDFLNVVKYPPALTFTLLTMGVNLLILGALSKVGARVQLLSKPLVIFGKVPLFFYILHLFLYAGLGLLLTPDGTSIPAMVPYWLFGLLILYPLCLWYGRFKGRQGANSVFKFL
jgi:uncharacterized membrane protein